MATPVATQSLSTGQTQAHSSQLKTTSSKPPVTLPSNSHLDPGAYVRGSHPINIGQNVLIHPRAHLLSIYCPLIIGDGCIIGEKCIIGGPLPPTQLSDGKTTDNSESNPEIDMDEDDGGVPTIIEPFSHLYANAVVDYGARVKSYCVIDSNTTIKSKASVGSHSKICSNLTITGAIPEWTVVWGSDNDQKRRRRKAQHDPTEDHKPAEAAEKQRLKVMDGHRDGTIALLKQNAAKALSVGSRSKR